jgi:hypothetical protein
MNGRGLQHIASVDVDDAWPGLMKLVGCIGRD